MLTLPEGTVLRTDHPTQRSLDLLDAGLVLAFNDKLKRYEVWRRQLTRKGFDYGFIVRVTAEPNGYAEPGEWLLTKLRARDSRYRPAQEAAEEVLSELRAAEEAAWKADEHRHDDLRDEIAREYLPLWKKKADPDGTTRDYKAWDPEPVHFPMSTEAS